jgi:hypothetical protein
MRRLLATAALLAAAAPPARAQAAAVAVPVYRAVAPAAVRPLAVYRFTTSRVAGLPAEVTVADSAGQLVASYRLPGDRADQPMLALIVGDDLVLQAETPRGVLTLQLRQQADAEPTVVTGTWRLEDREGSLRGRILR